MKRVLFDTNVVLDVLLDRQRFADASARVWAAIETGVAEGLLAAHSVTTIHYLVRREIGNSQAGTIISSLLGVPLGSRVTMQSQPAHLAAAAVTASSKSDNG